VLRNFSNRPAWQPALGLAEETGELVHSFLKRAQGIRCEENHDEGIRDALADLVVFACDFANAVRIDLRAVTLRELQERVSAELASAGGSTRPGWYLALGIVAKLGRVAELCRDGPDAATVEPALADLVLAACDFASTEDVDLQAVLETTWAEVRRRDWVVHREEFKGGSN
jgi:NTP pyrophosphatase (non-canonical NTP hydrolase)